MKTTKEVTLQVVRNAAPFVLSAAFLVLNLLGPKYMPFGVIALGFALYGTVDLIRRYGEGLLYGALCELVASLNQYRDKRPGDQGHINEMAVFCTPPLETLNRILDSVQDPMDDEADRTVQASTGLPSMFLVKIIFRTSGMLYCLVKRRFIKPDDDNQDDMTDAGDPVLVEPLHSPEIAAGLGVA